jgi:translation initiation factor IF-2
MDRPKSAENLKLLQQHTALRIVPLSAQYGRGVKEVMAAVRDLVEQLGNRRASKSTETAASYARLIAVPRNQAPSSTLSADKPAME